MKTATRVSPDQWTGLNLQNLDNGNLMVFRNDRTEHKASGLLKVGSGAVRVEIAINVANDMMTVTALLDGADGDTSASGLLRVQERAPLTQIIPDDALLTIRAASYCPGTTALKTVFDLLARDIRAILSDSRLWTGQRMIAN